MINGGKMDFMSCGSPCVLSITGMLNAAVAPSYAGYAFLGYNVGQDSGASTNTPVTPKGSTITPTYTASPTGLVVRAQITGASGMRYCYPATGSAASGTPISYSDFKVACYNGATAGASYSSSDPIANFQLSIAGGATTQQISVTLTNVKEN
jgi:hypothetical protein